MSALCQQVNVYSLTLIVPGVSVNVKYKTL